MPRYIKPLIATPDDEYSFGNVSQPFGRAAQINFNLSQEANEEAELVAKENDIEDQQGIPAGLIREADNNLISRYTDISILNESLKRMMAEKPSSAAYVRKNIPAYERVAEIKPITEDMMRQDFQYVSPYERDQQIKAAHVQRAQDLAEKSAVMRYLSSIYPDDFRDTTDEDLRKMLDIASRATGIDTSDWDLADFRRYGLSWDLHNVEGSAVFNLLGMRDIRNFVTNVYEQEKFKDLDLSRVNENSPLDQILYKEKLLREEYEALRGKTTALEAVDSAIASIPYWVEMGMTGGIAGIAGRSPTKLIQMAMRNGYRSMLRQGGIKKVASAVGKGLKYAGIGAAKRAPLYIPKSVAEAYNNYYLNGVVTVPAGDGDLLMQVPESRVEDFWQGLITSMLMQTTEVFTEELGGLLPDFTAPIRNRIVTRLAWNAATRNTTRRALQGVVPYHGFLGEMFEEEAANFIDRFWTIAMQVAGAEEYNTPGTETWFLHGRELDVTAGSIFLQSVPFYLLGLPSSIGTIHKARRAKGFIDHAAEEREAFSKTGLPDTNRNQARFVKDSLSQGDIDVVLTPHAAEAIYNKFVLPDDANSKSNQEALANIGITQESIRKASAEGKNLVISYNQAQTVGAARQTYPHADEIADAVIKSSSTMQIGHDMQSLSSDNFSKQELDRLHDEYQKTIEFKRDLNKKYDKQIDDVKKKAGLNENAARAAKHILHQMTNLLDRGANEKGRQFLADEAEKFFVDFAANPEEAIRKKSAHLRDVIRRQAEARLKVAEEQYKEARADFQEEEDAFQLAKKQSPNVVKPVPESWLNARDAYEAAKKEVEAARKNLDDANAVIKDLENPVEKTAEQVSPVWTGSAANYEQPDLHFVGTGEGAQVFGWGLYGSESRSVADWYAQADVRRKNSVKREVVFLDGERVEKPEENASLFRVLQNIRINGYQATIRYLERELERQKKTKASESKVAQTQEYLDIAKRLEIKHDWMSVLQRLVNRMAAEKKWDIASMSDEELLKRAKEEFPRLLEEERQGTAVAANRSIARNDEKWSEFYTRETLAAEEAIKNLRNLTDGSVLRSMKHNLYKQTFWPGKQEDLLDWDETATEEQAEKIAEALVKETDNDNVRAYLMGDRWAPAKSTVTFGTINEDGSRFIFLKEDDRGMSATIAEDGTILRNSFDDRLSGQNIELLFGKPLADFILKNIGVEEGTDMDFNGVELSYGEELIQYFVGSTGKQLYDDMVALFGSPKAASEFLYRAGIDGVTYIGDSSGVRNYVAFNDADIRVDEHIVYQLAGSIGAANMQDAQERAANRKLAEMMDAAGVDAKTIWLETGWNKQADGDFAFELPDLKVKEDSISGNVGLLLTMRLDELVTADEIFEAYPQLRDYKFSFALLDDEDVIGEHEILNREIRLNTAYFRRDGIDTLHDNPNATEEEIAEAAAKLAKAIRKPLIHEVQHAIQYIEGWAIGSSTSAAEDIRDEDDPAYAQLVAVIDELQGNSQKLWDEITELGAVTFADYGAVSDAIYDAFYSDEALADLSAMLAPYADNENVQRILAATREINDNNKRAGEAKSILEYESTAFRRYYRTAGEVQANNAMFRSSLSKKSRENMPPSETESVEREFQIILKDEDADATVRSENADNAEAAPDEEEKEEQKKEKRGPRGQFFMNEFQKSQVAVITLFKNSDASTLPHESAHWLLEMMRYMVANGLANETMEADLKQVEEWLNRQDYSPWKVAKSALLRDDKGNLIYDKNGDPIVDMEVARQEYFAEAFEMYLKNGVFPESAPSGLRSALRALKRMLMEIYQFMKDSNAIMDESITSFFDSMFVADYLSEQDSELAQILRSINEGILAMSNEEMNDLEKDLAEAKKDSLERAWYEAIKSYRRGVLDRKPIWKAEAEDAYYASKEEKARRIVEKKPLDYGVLRWVMGFGADMLKGLRGLVTNRISKSEFLKATAAPATTEQAPAQTPTTAEGGEPTAETASAKNIVETPKQFNAAPEDEIIHFPDDDKLSTLVYGDNADGVIWNRIKNGLDKLVQDIKNLNYSPMDAKDAMSIVYDVAIKKRDEGVEKTKKEWMGYLHNVAANAIKGSTKGQVALKKLNQQLKDAGNEDAETTIGDTVAAPEIVSEERLKAAEAKIKAAILSALDGIIAQSVGMKKDIARIYRRAYEKYSAMADDDKLAAWYAERHPEFKLESIKHQIREVVKEAQRAAADSVLSQSPVDASNADPVEILKVAQECGYESVDDLINALKMSKGHDRFVREFIEEREEKYREDFLNNPVWNSEAGATEYLDAILKALKLTKGMKYSQRVKNAKVNAVRELRDQYNVGGILKSIRALEIKMRTDADLILKALKKGKKEKEAAITASLDMHATKARLHAARELQEDILKTTRKIKRVMRTKRGEKIEGDSLSAIKAFARYFGFSEANPDFRPAENAPGNVIGVLREIAERKALPNETPAQAFERERMFWSPWMNDIIDKIGDGTNGGMKWSDLTLDQFLDVEAMIDYLEGAGRDFVAKDKESFAAKLASVLDKVIPRLQERKGWHINNSLEEKLLIEKIAHFVRRANATKTFPSAAMLLDGNSEFGSKKEIGPFRRMVELPVAAGDSKYRHLTEKISKAIKEPIEKLMASCKSRDFTVTNKNDNTKGGSYTTIRGAQLAFILLNAGNVEGRQRLMSGFGWSEEELNGILKQFSEEDYKNAEKIWKALSELGRELADEFYRQRHYRMKMVDAVGIELTNYEGKQIVSGGGYYPIGYAYVVKKSGSKNIDPSDYDMLSPMQKSIHPLNLADPGSTITRQKEVEGALRLDSTVLYRSIKDNAYFIGLAEPMKLANAVAKDPDFRREVENNFGKEFLNIFDRLMLSANHIYDRKLESDFIRKTNARMATLALGYKLSVILKQLGSLLTGIDRIKGYGDSLARFAMNPRGMVRQVSEISVFCRDRFNLIDRDLSVLDEEFKSGRLKLEAYNRRVAYIGMKYLDLLVAAAQWEAAYNDAYPKFLTERAKAAQKSEVKEKLSPEDQKQIDAEIEEARRMARAYADDFVALSQGGARDIDIPAVQMNQIMRILTPFCGPAIAAFNTRVGGLDAMFNGKMSTGDAVKFFVYNFAFPALWNGLVMSLKGGLLYAAFGGGDDDDAKRAEIAFWKAVLSEPLSGIPIVQDINEAMVGMLLDKRNTLRNGIFDVSALRPLEDITRDTGGILMNIDNPAYVLYLSASALGELLGIPAVQVIEDWEKWLKNNSAYDKTLKQRAKESVQ